MSGRLAIVTGTSSGIGAALMERMLDDGWVVFGLARREVKHANPAYRHIQADLSDPGTAAAVVAPRVEAELAFGDFDRLALVNNAAAAGQKRVFGAQSDSETFRNIAINLAAPMALMDMVLKIAPSNAMLRIVNFSSGLARQPLPGAGDYCASKAGLRMAGQVLATELEAAGNENAALFSYEPGIVDTAMQADLRSADAESFPAADMFKTWHSEQRLASPGDVIVPILDFLADNSARGFSEGRFGNT